MKKKKISYHTGNFYNQVKSHKPSREVIQLIWY